MSDALGRERVATALFYAALILLVWLVYLIFAPFLVPLGWAAVLVVVFHPWHARLEKRWGKARAAGLSTAAVTLIVILPAIFLGIVSVREGLQAVDEFQQARAAGHTPMLDTVQTAWEWVQARIPVSLSLNLGDMVRDAAQKVGGFLASKTGTVVANVLGFFFDLFVMLFATFFFFRDREAIVDRFRRLLPFEASQRAEMIERARDLIHASVTSTLIVALLQGFLGGVAFAALGMGAPVFWGVVMAFFALIPLLGTGIVLGPAVVWLLLNGAWGKAAILAGLSFFVIGMVDNFLRPILVSGRAQMSTLVLFISVLGGISVFGMLGLVMGPIVVATAASVMDVYVRRSEPGPARATVQPT